MTTALITLGKICPSTVVIGDGPSIEAQGEVKPKIVAVEDRPAPTDLKPTIIKAEEQ